MVDVVLKIASIECVCVRVRMCDVASIVARTVLNRLKNSASKLSADHWSRSVRLRD